MSRRTHADFVGVQNGFLCKTPKLRSCFLVSQMFTMRSVIFLWHPKRPALHLSSLVGFRDYLSTFFENQDRCLPLGLFFPSPFICCNFLYSNDPICNCLWVPGMPCVQVLKGELAGCRWLNAFCPPHPSGAFLLLSSVRSPKAPSPEQIWPLPSTLCSVCASALWGFRHFANHPSYRF